MLKFYRALISFRKTEPALKHLNRKNLEVEFNEEDKTLLLWRWHENQKVVCIMNFSDQPQKINWRETEREYRKLISSSDPEWLGPNSAPDIIWGLNVIPLEAESFSIYAADV